MFKRRTEAPKKTNAYYFSDKNIFYKYGYGMPNCTAYAYGRYAELWGIYLPIIKGKARGNAEDWFDVIKANDKFKTSDKPQLGAVACWKCGKILNGSDGAGHVAIVEEILPNGDTITSNSAYKGTEWYEQTLKASEGYNWTSSISGKKYIFQGFILPPVVNTDMVAVTSTFLRAGAGKRFRPVCGIKKNETFCHDGQTENTDGIKWLHGSFKNSSGWIPSTEVKCPQSVSSIK